MNSKFSKNNGSASFQPRSQNRKLSRVLNYRPKDARYDRLKATRPYCCSTYVSIEATCPDTCKFKNNGCYVQAGFTQRAAKILDSNAKGMIGDRVIEKEVELIDSTFPNSVPQDGATGGRDLRLHIGGDTSSRTATLLLAGAAERWLKKGGGAVWAYTHRWKEVSGHWWNPINAFASVETVDEANEAWRRGYKVAITVLDFKKDGMYRVGGKRRGIKILPCPAQTKKAVCVECRLCLDKLKGKVAIGFSLHGSQVSMAKNVLADLDQMNFGRLF